MHSETSTREGLLKKQKQITTTEIASDYSELSSTDILIQIHLEMTEDHSYLIYKTEGGGAGGGVIPYNSLYGEVPPKRGTLFRLQVYKRVGKLVI